MSEGNDDAQEKNFDATEGRIQKSRREGDVAQSTEAHTFMLYTALGIFCILGAAYTVKAVYAGLSKFLAWPDQLGEELFSGGQPKATLGALGEVLIGIAPLFAALIISVFLSVIVQQAMTFTPSKAKPKLSRISPVSNAKQKYGGGGLVEFAKRSVKMTLVALATLFILGLLFFQLPGLSLVPVGELLIELRSMSMMLIGCVIIIAGLITFVDLPYTHFAYLKKLRMSFQEIRDEAKDSEGDPHLKQARRARARAIAQNSMLRDVGTADVVIVNPTHYAVALKWDRQSGGVPVCVGKGVDEVAGMIRSRATQSGVPIHSDPPSARAIYSAVEVGQIIKPEHYAAVAAAIYVADQLKPKAW